MYDFKDEVFTNGKDTGEILINEILEEVANAPGALSLLSFTMYQFYEIARDKGQRLLLKDYREVLQGVEGSIGRKADEVFENLSAADKQLMRKLLLRMVNLYDGGVVRRRVYFSVTNTTFDPSGQLILNELDFGAENQKLEQLVQLMERANLLILGRDDEIGVSYVEPTHDSLINHWEKCRRWIEDFGTDTISLQRRLWQVVLDYRKGQLDLDLLDDGGLIGPPLSNGNIINGNLSLDGALSNGDEGEDLLGNVTHTWEFNPRLDEVTKALLDPKERWIERPGNEFLGEVAQLVWDDSLSTVELLMLEDSQIQETGEETLIKLILDGANPSGINLEQAIKTQWDNWLNADEKEFIKASWTLRQGTIQQLTRERNEAATCSTKSHLQYIRLSIWHTYRQNHRFSSRRICCPH